LKFLVGNKCDLKNQRKVTEEEGRTFGIYLIWLLNIIIAKAFNLPFIETSAKETINTNELFDLTMRTYINKMNSGGRKTENGRTNLVINVNKDNKKDSENGCCSK